MSVIDCDSFLATHHHFIWYPCRYTGDVIPPDMHAYIHFGCLSIRSNIHGAGG